MASYSKVTGWSLSNDYDGHTFNELQKVYKNSIEIPFHFQNLSSLQLCVFVCVRAGVRYAIMESAEELSLLVANLSVA